MPGHASRSVRPACAVPRRIERRRPEFTESPQKLGLANGGVSARACATEPAALLHMGRVGPTVMPGYTPSPDWRMAVNVRPDQLPAEGGYSRTEVRLGGSRILADASPADSLALLDAGRLGLTEMTLAAPNAMFCKGAKPFRLKQLGA